MNLYYGTYDSCAYKYILLYKILRISKMRLSIYTYIFTHKGHFYVYNSEGSILSEISEKLYSQLYEEDFNAIESGLLDILKRKHIIVEDDETYSYYNKMKMLFYSKAYDKERIGLVVVPYTGCNFACPYCFEEKKNPQRMSEKVEDEIILFLLGHKSAKSVNITWYGGEPLLAFKNIKSLYTKIKENTPLSIGRHSIVTNGYLINDEVLNFFKETNLNHMQITLDGLKAQHDSTRFLKNSKEGTYDRIMENIAKVLEELPNCSLSIRININKKNQHDFYVLHSYLKELYKSKRIHIYPGFIREENKDRNSLCYQSFDADEIVPFYEEIKNEGGNVNFFPYKSAKGCMIHKLNSYIIGPEGEFYKCWNDVGDATKIIGYIDKDELINKPLLYRYMNETSPFDNDECKDCLLFPVCSGGCGLYRYKNLFEKGKFNICSEYKDTKNLETALINSIAQCDMDKPVIRM